MGQNILLNFNGRLEGRLFSAMDRYVNNLLRINNMQGEQIQLLLVNVEQKQNDTREWDIDKLMLDLEEYKGTQTLEKTGDYKPAIDGIIFYTPEESSRGDLPNSSLNQTRMIREMLESSFNAVTINYSNFYAKIRQLVAEILMKDRRHTFREALEKLKILQNIVARETNNQLEKVSEFEVFCRNIGISADSKKKPLTFISRFYPLGGIHSSKLGHDSLRELSDILEKENQSSEELKGEKCIEASWEKIVFLENIYDLASVLANNPLRHTPVKILIIDDNPVKVMENFEKKNIAQFFPPESEIYITAEWEWKKFLVHSIFWSDMYKGKAALKLYTFGSRQPPKPKDLFVNQTFVFDYVVVDLLMGDYNEGNTLINNLVEFRKNYNRLSDAKKSFWDIIAFSLSKEGNDISRALNEGSLHYIQKSRAFMLPAFIGQFEKSRLVIGKRGDTLKAVQKSRNFGKLYRLPEIAKRRLQTEPFLDLLKPSEFKTAGESFNRENTTIENLSHFLIAPSYEWIENMPKADIHCHLGGSIDAYTAFYLSLNMISGIEEQDEAALSSLIIEYINLMKIILDKNFDLILDFFIILKAAVKTYFLNDLHIFENTLKLELGINKSYRECACWYHRIKDEIHPSLKGKKIEPLKVDNELSEKIFLKIVQKKHSKGFEKVPSLNIFNVIVGILERKDDPQVEAFWGPVKDAVNIVGKLPNGCWNVLNFPGTFNETEFHSFIKRNKDTFEFFKNKLSQAGVIATGKHNRVILKHFISAKQRKTQSLAEYLGGCEFMGSEQLQRKENIVAALFYIIERRANDNVRLLELKASPDGYTRQDLTLQEAVQTMLLATDLITLYFYDQGKFIRVNFIFTVKRHKSPKEAALEVSAAIVNRERERVYHDIRPTINEKNVNIVKYEWKPSRVVGIDLAGLEKGNPAKNFVNDFFPLFKTSSFITVHAGEEDTAQSIWEAIYILHANRIGHGLTLNEDLDLKDLFKNIQICIEMNPISNTLTNKGIERKYPLYPFILDGLKVTINTDNPAVSDSTLSDEYVKAAELFQLHKENERRHWISKWEIIRIIKNAFSSAFLDREEKRNLLRAVEEEIYQKIIEEYGL